MKQKNNNKTENKERYFGVLLESMDKKIDLVLEGHSVLDKKIDQVDFKVDDLKKEMDYKFETVFDELHLIRNDLKKSQP